LVINGNNEQTAKIICETIQYLKQQSIISDYSDCVILMRSVKESPKNAGPIANELRKNNIPVYNPRARNLHERQEIMEIFGLILNLLDELSDNSLTQEINNNINKKSKKELYTMLKGFLIKAAELLKKQWDVNELYQKTKIEIKGEMEKISKFCKLNNISNNSDQITLENKFKNLNKQEKPFMKMEKGKYIIKDSLPTTIQEIFFKFLNAKYFMDKIEQDPEIANNLALISQIFDSFYSIYGTAIKFDIINSKIQDYSIRKLINKLFLVIEDEGLSEPEDPDFSIVKGKVQIMTFHQAKGLEFPFVFCQHINSEPKEDDSHILEDLFKNYRKIKPEGELLENGNTRAFFDHVRLIYVGLSRPINGLIIFGTGTLKKNTIDEKWTLSLGYDKNDNSKASIVYLTSNGIDVIKE